MLDKLSYKHMDKFNHVALEHIYGDIGAIKRILNIYEDLKTSAYREGNINILGIVLDLELAIQKCNFNKPQMERLELWMDGHTETEIAIMCNVRPSVIHRFINTVCAKISAELV